MVGDASALTALVHLGEEYTLHNRKSPGALELAATGVHGKVAALRALPGLGADWGPDCADCAHTTLSFTPCTAFGGEVDVPSAENKFSYVYGATDSPGCEAAGLPPVADASDVAGGDECACCGAEAPRGHDDAGACTAAQSSGGGILSNILSMFGMKQEL